MRKSLQVTLYNNVYNFANARAGYREGMTAAARCSYKLLHGDLYVTVDVIGIGCRCIISKNCELLMYVNTTYLSSWLLLLFRGLAYSQSLYLYHCV